jgi:hypothetical protein
VSAEVIFILKLVSIRYATNQKVRCRMQVVINISEEDYEGLKRNDKFNDMHLNYYEKLIANGVPLPKGHGRLVDADEIDNNIYDLTRGMDLNYGQISEVVDTAPTIIEKDDD